MIVNGHVEYDIPKEISDKIPDYFYLAMLGELVSIMGPDILKPVDWDGPEYYDFHSSTGGWVEALYETCRKLDMEWLKNYWKTLEWYDSDVFDGIIESRIAEKLTTEDFTANSYYKHLLKKSERT